MFRKATANDIDALEALYERVHTAEENGTVSTGWKRGIYPTRATVETAIEADDMFVLEVEGKIVSCARLNYIQMPEYQKVTWTMDAADEEVLVMHTLAVDPAEQKKGYARIMLDAYEKTARDLGCKTLRIDTNERNNIARRMYAKNGYTEVGIVPCTFNGIAGVGLVCLEKNL